MKNPVYTLETIFCEGSNYSRQALKRKIIREKLIPYSCAMCHNTGIWNESLLSLQIDHKNGICNDNRLSNLQFLCPNCHSQTETYAGKNSKGMRSKDPIPSFRQVKAAKDRALWEEVKADPSMKIGSWGWKQRVGDRLSITSQKVSQWIKRVDSSFEV